MKRLLALGAGCLMFIGLDGLMAQSPATNLDEGAVKPYTLPDPLLMKNGNRVTNSQQWTNIQRPYIYQLYQENMFGRYPTQKTPVRFSILERSNLALGGRALRKQVRLYLRPSDTTVYVDLLIYLPDQANRKIPVFLGYNFYGNQAVWSDSAILISKRWMREKSKGVVNNRATDSTRGVDPGWQVEDIISRGYGVVTAYYGDIEPDHKEGWKSGIRTTMKDVLQIQPSEWGAIGAWAWGLSRIMDYLEQDASIDSKKVMVFGHSRLGKAAIWAGASDQRFSMVISNESGEGGAALSKRWYGETVRAVNTSFPYWFAPSFTKYNDNTEALPFDGHMLLALIAPRPLYVASAVEDRWSDPKGEFLGAYFAGPVYALFGKKGLGTASIPPTEMPVGNTIRYHIREGKHDVTRYDWKEYMNFADKFR